MFKRQPGIREVASDGTAAAEASVIEELRQALQAPYVRVRMVGGVDVRCWISTISFRCPQCGSTNLASAEERLTGHTEVGCGWCDARFELEYR
jgi:hypothetical protein